jgi:hypothetical protein
MLCHVGLVRTDDSEEDSTPTIRVTRISELGTFTITSNRSPILVTLMMDAICSSETSVLTRPTWHNIPEDGILHSHRRENLKSYTVTLCCCKNLLQIIHAPKSLFTFLKEKNILAILFMQVNSLR